MAEETRVDVRAVVAGIEAEVRRRREAGEYPEELLERLRAEFHPGEDAREAPEALALVEAARPLAGGRLGPVTVFTKRVVRRLLAWYVAPIARDQSRFNAAITRELRALERRLARVETPASPRAPGSPGVDAGARALLGDRDSERAAALAALLADRPAGRVLAAGSPAVVGLLRRDLPDLEEPGSLLAALEDASGDVAAVVLAGVLPRLSAAELVGLGPLLAGALRTGGVVAADAPRRDHPSAPADPSALDVDLLRWLEPSTVVLLLEAAGLGGVSVHGAEGGTAWYAVGARLGG